MSCSTAAVQVLLARASAGCEGASRQLVQMFGAFVLKTVRQRLNPKLRQKYDSADFSQQAWMALFERRQLLDRFETRAAFQAYLQATVRSKIVQQIRMLARQKRQVEKECRMDRLTQGQAFAHDPTPSAVLVSQEQYDQLLKDRSAVECDIIRLRATDHTFREIAEQLEISESAVRRVIARLRCCLSSA